MNRLRALASLLVTLAVCMGPVIALEWWMDGLDGVAQMIATGTLVAVGVGLIGFIGALNLKGYILRWLARLMGRVPRHRMRVALAFAIVVWVGVGLVTTWWVGLIGGVATYTAWQTAMRAE